MFEYNPKTLGQLRAWYYNKTKTGLLGILDFAVFKSWYDMSDKVCHYCGLSEVQSQMIVRNGLLKSKRFPQNGVHGRGTSRGMWLEIDRYNPNGLYEIGNIVLCCYFCNNDKSDVFHGNDYKLFIKNRREFFKRFL